MSTADMLSLSILRELNPPELASHFRSLIPSLVKAVDYSKITSQLLAFIHNGDVPPEVFDCWLNLAQRQHPHLIKDALLDTQSQGVLAAGLIALGRALRKKEWKEQGWDAVGGVDGLYEVFKILSTQNSKRLASTIGKRMRTKGPEGHRLADDLVRRLITGLGRLDRKSSSPVDTAATLNHRPILASILHLFLACSPSFLSDFLSKPLPRSVPLPKLLVLLGRSHVDILRKIAMGTLKVDSRIRTTLLSDIPKVLVSSMVPYEPQLVEKDTFSFFQTPGLVFAFDVLEAWKQSVITKQQLPRSNLLNSIVIPAADLASRRKIPFDGVLKLFESAFVIIKATDGNFINSLSEPFPSKVISCWAISTLTDTGQAGPVLSRFSQPKAGHKKELEELVCSCIRALKELKFTGTVCRFPRDVFDLTQVRAPTRLRLFKLLCRHLPGINLDLELEHTPGSQGSRLSWEVGTFAILPMEDSKWLFEKLSSLNLQDRIDYARLGDFGIDHSGNAPRWYRKGLLDVKWESEDPTAVDYPKTRKLLDATMKQAETERDPHRRKSWAEMVVDVVTLSRSIPLMQECVQWARRFLRDPLTGPYIGSKLCDIPAARVLACTSFPSSHRPMSGAALSRLVQEANAILRFHLQTALLAIREPHIKSHHVEGPLDLLRGVMGLRFDGIGHYRKLGLQSESELSTILLDSTLPILLEYEREGISEGHEALEWQYPAGPIRFLYCVDSYKAPSHFVTQYLDRLARERNELWAQERVRRKSSIVSLGQGFPKGLPVQCLLPDGNWDEAAVANPAAAPYFCTRLQEVIFCQPDEATQAVLQDTEVIGCFVDDLCYAIRAYVRQRPTEAIIEIWDHYTRIIPPTAGHVEEVRKLLLDIADNQRLKGLYTLLQPQPLLPSPLPSYGTGDGELGPAEWDPFPRIEGEMVDYADLSNRESEPTVLRCRFKIGATGFYSPFSQPFEHPKEWIGLRKYRKVDIWKPDLDVRKLPLNDCDRLIQSAILFLDSFTNKPRLLSTAFPANSSEPRYPPLYLDYDFLSTIGSEDIDEPTRRESSWDYEPSWSRSEPSEDAIQVLGMLKRRIPPQLLEQLAASYVQSLMDLPAASPKHREMTTIAFEILSLLSQSDRPQLAVDLRLKVLEHMPDASSWHRRVMSSGLANRLDPHSADTMLKSFGRIIVNGLKGQEKHLKITTLKILPEMIRASRAMTLGATLDVLKSLFSASSHIDVRNEILKTLFGLFEKYDELEPEVATRGIFDALTPFIVAVSGPSERFLVSEEQWQEAENGGPLPEVSEDRPLQESLFNLLCYVPEKAKEYYVRQVILRIIDESTKQHNRWMRILLSRVNLSPEEASFTNFGPFKGESVSKALELFCAYLPRSYLPFQRDWVMRYQARPLLMRIDKKLMTNNPEWDETDPSRQHWMSFLKAHEGMNLFDSVNYLLRRYEEPKIADGITLEDLEVELLERAQFLLRNPLDMSSEPPQMHLSYFESEITFLTKRVDSEDEKQAERARRILDGISNDVETLRALRLSSSDAEQPTILPSRMEIQAALLTLPREHNLHKPEVYRILADRLLSLIEECSRTPSCLADFEYLDKRLTAIVPAQALPCALAIGARIADIHSTLHGCLSIQLALKLLNKAKAASKEGSKELRILLSQWKESPVEWVRRIGWEESAKLN